MKYIDVVWKHLDVDYPIRLISELDEQRFETRKIEVYRDGKVGYARQDKEHNGTELGYEPVPPIEEINKSEEFAAELIEKEDFERLWAQLVTEQ